MTLLNAILAATDFSAGARLAVERAARVAAAAGVPRRTLLHAVDTPWFELFRQLAGHDGLDRPGPLDQAAALLAELAAEIERATGVRLEPVVRPGRPVDAIAEAAADADLLVLGAHGAHPLRELALGTTAQRLIRKTRRPVLVVKRAPEADYRRVLVAIDFSPHSQRALAWARAVAPGAEIVLVHAFEALFEGKMQYAGVGEEAIAEFRARARQTAETDMAQFVADNDATALRRIIEHGHPATRLRSAAQALGADLVVAGKHGKSLTEQLLLGSVTLHLLAEMSCDVLVTQ